MKKIKKIFGMAAMITMLASNIVYAQNPVLEEIAISDYQSESVLLPSNVLESQNDGYAERRGVILSTAMLTITNQQDGTLYVTVNTVAHRNVDKIYQTVFLDEWNEEDEDWVKVGYWEFERSKEEEEDGNLSSYHVGFTVQNATLNKYYRARAIHLVELGDDLEGKSTQTNGVLLTDHEV